MRIHVALGLAAVATVLAVSEAEAIPAWARKYNMPCSGCHYPAPPRLNTVGQQFRWAGYRMPNEIGQRMVVERIEDFIAMRGRFRYTHVARTGQPTQSGFTVNDATLFYAGSMLENYTAFFELEREAEDEIGLTAHVQTEWGTAQRFWGFRGGPMHWVQRVGLAGFDRPTGISTPSALSATTTAGTGAVPFRINGDQLGVEGYYVTGRNRFSAMVLNGINDAGAGTGGDVDKAKDVAVTYSRILDDVASGLTAVGYYGTLGRDSTRHFIRLSASANKVWNDNELLAGLTYSRDSDLPGATTEVTGQAFFVGLQRFFRSNNLAVFGRFDLLDPDTDTGNNRYQVYTLGAVLPVGNPQYVRLALEGQLTSYQNPATKSLNKIVAELMVNF